MSLVQINMLDEIYPYKGYVLVNDIYKSEHGVYKHRWMWGVKQGDFILDAHELKDFSCHSFSDFTKAHNKFIQAVDKKLQLNEINC